MELNLHNGWAAINQIIEILEDKDRHDLVDVLKSILGDSDTDEIETDSDDEIISVEKEGSYKISVDRDGNLSLI